MGRTNIDLDDRLVKTGLRLTKYKTKKQLINEALKEFVRRIKRKGIIKFKGSNCWEGDLDKLRRSRF